MAFTYLTADRLDEDIDKIVKPRLQLSAGFNIPFGESLSYGLPKEGCHFDGVRKKPITYLCNHEEVDGKMPCQPWAPIAYLLISAYVKGDIPDDVWPTLVLKRGSRPFLGSPEFAPFDKDHPYCAGFKFVPGPDKPQLHLPNSIRMGYSVNRLTLCMDTKKYDHVACNELITWKFALFRAYALNLLEGYNPLYWTPTAGKLNLLSIFANLT